MKFKPEIFIIESLRLNDEKANRFEGKIIADILNLKKKKCIYYYVRTKKEFYKILKQFEKSEYRYLHISCHGNEKEIATTFDDISFNELGKYLGNIMNEKRLFFSSCKVVNALLADAIFSNSGCLSILGPSNKIGFDDATVFWTTFYHTIFNINVDVMKNVDIKLNASQISNLLNVKLNYYGKKGDKITHKKI